MESSSFETLLYILIITAVTAVGLVLYRKEIAFLFKAKKVPGKVVNWMSAVIGGKRYFYPMIEFTPHGYEAQLFRAEDRCEGEPLYPPGTQVEVKYLPGDIEFRKVIYPAKG